MGLDPWAKTCIYYLVPWGLWAGPTIPCAHATEGYDESACKSANLRPACHRNGLGYTKSAICKSAACLHRVGLDKTALCNLQICNLQSANLQPACLHALSNWSHSSWERTGELCTGPGPDRAHHVPIGPWARTGPTMGPCPWGPKMGPPKNVVLNQMGHLSPL